MAGASETVLVLTGPTAVGKSAVALALARLTPIEIISADSRQVYVGLDAGTAKPTAAERAWVNHHGLDLVEPAARYSAGRFAREAAVWIDGAAARGATPVVVGGTGLYLRALFEGLFQEPDLDAGRRRRLGAVLAALPLPALDAWARRLDPGFGGGGRQRAGRAVEVALLAGRPLSALQRVHAAAPGLRRPWYARLALPRDVLALRIEGRVRAMLDAGLVGEVERALASGLPPDAPGLTGVGYRQVVELLAGRLARPDLVAAIVTATRRYAKRQETWFRHQLPPDTLVLDAAHPPDALARQVLSGYRAAENR